MRKNKMMRTAAVLGVAALLTTSALSGTLAKYTTTATGGDTARVAKWGVEIAANGETFAKSYNEKKAAQATVNSTEKIVAPGTSGEMAKMTLSGTPEVAVKVSYAGGFNLGDGWKINTNEFYCPLIIKVKNSTNETTIQQNTTNITTAEAFNKAVNDAIAAYSQEYAPGTDLSKQGNDSLTVTWEWPFEDTTENNKAATDVKNTALGDLTTAPTVTLKVTTTVTQID